jgi:hypothetical protein
MPLYQNSIIYKLCHQNDLENKNIYVGSTTNFRNRKNQHKKICCNEKNKKYNFPVYQFIRDNDGWDNWQMIPIEVFPCNDNNELLIRERHHIELLKPNLNKQIPTRSKEEYYNDNKKEILQYKKQYYEDNKENKNQKVICDRCGAEINKQGLKRHQKTKKCIETV